MATKKYLTLEGLQEYDALLKEDMEGRDTATLSSAKDYSDDNLDASKTYTDTAVAQKSSVQIIKWEAND